MARTLRHEVLGHYALNTFQPAHKRAILDAIAATRGDPAFAQTWSDVDSNYPGRSDIGKAEEVYCAFAEYAAAGRASSSGQTALEQTCFSKQRPLTDRDLAAIVDHVADGLHRNTRRQQTFPATDAEQFRSAERTNDIKASTYDERVADHRETIRARRRQDAAPRPRDVVASLRNVPVPEVAKRAHTYLSTTDLADRWGYSSRWVRELGAARDFPDPAFAVSRDLIPIWGLDDVEAWESRNDPTLKHNRRLAAQQLSSPRRHRSSYTPPLGATYEQRVAFCRELFRQRRVRQRASRSQRATPVDSGLRRRRD